MMGFGLHPLGTIASVGLTDRLGVPLVIAMQGGLVTAIFALVGLLKAAFSELP